MKLSPISFCNRTAYNLVNDTDKDNILDLLYNKYKISIGDHNYKVYKSNMKFYNSCISRYNYLMSTNTCGNTYLLFFTRDPNLDINLCYFIDNKICSGYKYPRIIHVKYRFDNSIFNGTVFIGNLIRDNDNLWHFLINNILCHNGKVLRTNLLDRIKLIHSILQNHYIPDTDLQCCDIRVKKYFQYKEYDSLLKFASELNYQCNGIIFNSIDTRKNNIVVLNKTYSTKQRKQTKPQTTIIQKTDKEIYNTKYFTFEIVKTDKPGIYQLNSKKNNTLKKYGYARIDGLKCNKFVRSLFNNTTSAIVDCLWSTKFNKWIPQKVSSQNISNFIHIERYLELKNI